MRGDGRDEHIGGGGLWFVVEVLGLEEPPTPELTP